MRRLIATLLVLLPLAARAEVTELRVTRQPSIIYLADIIMEQQKLVEKAAAGARHAGADDEVVRVQQRRHRDRQLLAGSVDIVTTGASNMLLLWDRTKGGVKGLSGGATLPEWAISRDPAVKSLRDLTPQDRIAVPTVKVSTQAILLQMAARQLFGDKDYAHFDAMEVTFGHPDAAVALMSGAAGITAHFSASPYQEQEAHTPGLHVIASSDDIVGAVQQPGLLHDGEVPRRQSDAWCGPLSPRRVRRARSSRRIRARRRRSTCGRPGEKYGVDELVQVMGDTKQTFDSTPLGMQKISDHMADTGVLRSRPASWKDFFFSEAWDQAGN